MPCYALARIFEYVQRAITQRHEMSLYSFAGMEAAFGRVQWFAPYRDDSRHLVGFVQSLEMIRQVCTFAPETDVKRGRPFHLRMCYVHSDGQRSHAASPCNRTAKVEISIWFWRSEGSREGYVVEVKGLTQVGGDGDDSLE